MRSLHIPSAAPLPRRTSGHRAPVLIEALGYLGGAVVLVGAMLITAQYWPDLGTGTRLLIVSITALVLLAAGFAVPQGSRAALRLRSILWLLSTAAGSAFWALLGNEALDWKDEHTVLLTGLATTLYSASLWALARSPIQQASTFVASLMAAGAAGALLDGSAWPGIGIWLASLGWLIAARAGRLPARRFAQAIATAGLIVGAGATMPSDAGIVFALATAAVVVGTGVVWRELAVVVIGALGLIQFLPVAMTTWFEGRAAAPIALLLGGGGLVGAAVALSRRTGNHEGTGIGRPAIDTERYDAVVFDLDSVIAEGAHAEPGSVALIDRLRAAKLGVAVVSADSKCAEALRASGLEDLFQVRVDGVIAAELGLPGMPDPAMFLMAARRLGVLPRRTVVVENAQPAIAAARAGGFGMVIAVSRAGRRGELLRAGADLVVDDLAELVLVQTEPR